MPTVDVSAASIEYRESGPANSAYPPVVFVHGALVDSRLWDAVAADLAARGFRCIQPDLPLGAHRIPVRQRWAVTPGGISMLIHEFLMALDLRDVTSSATTPAAASVSS